MIFDVDVYWLLLQEGCINKGMIAHLQLQQPTAAISAAAVVVTVPVVVLTLLFQRKIVAGLTAGAVKG